MLQVTRSQMLHRATNAIVRILGTPVEKYAKAVRRMADFLKIKFRIASFDDPGFVGMVILASHYISITTQMRRSSMELKIRGVCIGLGWCY